MQAKTKRKVQNQIFLSIGSGGDLLRSV